MSRRDATIRTFEILGLIKFAESFPQKESRFLENFGNVLAAFQHTSNERAQGTLTFRVMTEEFRISGWGVVRHNPL